MVRPKASERSADPFDKVDSKRAGAESEPEGKSRKKANSTLYYKFSLYFSSNTCTPTFSNLIMPSTPTPPTSTLQSFLGFQFCRLKFCLWSISPFLFQIIWQIDVFHSLFMPNDFPLKVSTGQDAEI